MELWEETKGRTRRRNTDDGVEWMKEWKVIKRREEK